MQSRVGAVARLVFVDLLGSIAWFPVWWYSTGVLKVINSSLDTLKYRVRSYAFAIWIKNFFVPMYGQYDITGKLVSVFMRFVILIARSIAIVVEALVYALGIVAWVVAPIIFFLLAITGFLHGFAARV
ncbi:MAG: hypothetical protein ABIO72_02215 [Patescibacteria group bacterium]